MATDPFDDFEFKPITEGLGFHKKAEKIKQDVKQTKLALDTIPDAPAGASAAPLRTRTPEPPAESRPELRAELFPAEKRSQEKSSRDRPASQSISDLIASLPPSLDFVNEDMKPAASSVQPTRPQIFQPIAREEFKIPTASSAASVMPGPTIGSVLPPPGTKAGGVSTSAAIPAPTTGVSPNSSPYRDKMNESYAKAFPHADQRPKTRTQETVNAEPGSKLVAVHNMPGAILDAMVVLGISTIFLVCILAITRVNLVGLLSNANTDVSTQFHLALLFVAVLQMYMLTARSFFGASLGEWAFDLHVGTDEQQGRAVYPLQIAWRTLLMTFTGFIVLPLISLFMKKDVAQPLTGLELIRRP